MLYRQHHLEGMKRLSKCYWFMELMSTPVTKNSEQHYSPQQLKAMNQSWKSYSHMVPLTIDIPSQLKSKGRKRVTRRINVLETRSRRLLN